MRSKKKTILNFDQIASHHQTQGHHMTRDIATFTVIGEEMTLFTDVNCTQLLIQLFLKLIIFFFCSNILQRLQ